MCLSRVENRQSFPTQGVEEEVLRGSVLKGRKSVDCPGGVLR